MTELLNNETVVDYIAQHPEFAEHIDVATAKAKEIGDGNLNLVFLVKDADGRGLVVKQTLPYVRSDHSWKVTEDSIFAEARGLEAADKYTNGLSPKFYGLDRDRRLVVIEDLSDWAQWREALDEGSVNPGAARDVGRFVARLAYGTSYFSREPQDVQKAAAESINPELEQITEDLIFEEPYYEHEHNGWEPGATDLVLALRDEELRTQVAKLKYEFLTNGEALLHGDLHSSSLFVRSEKNPLADDDTESPRIKAYDFEFGFYGPVAFDLGILWGNFLLAQARELALLADGPETIGVREGKDFARFDWLISLYEEAWDGFETEFRRLVGEHKADKIFTDAFVDGWIARTLRFAAGYAGAEGIRRTIGWAHLPDLETLDPDRKVWASRVVLTASRALLERFEEVGSAADVRRIVEESIPTSQRSQA